MKKSRRTIQYVIMLLLIILVMFLGIKRLIFWIELKSYSKYIDYPSLLPKIRRTMAVRFDPSFYYNGIRPKKMARELAERWEKAGINLLYYRAYDPRYGAFYHTRYELNREGEFGKYDLLKHILKECHNRNIRVFGWLPVMNHQGAWQSYPEWRAKRPNGKNFSDIGLEFPLCARIKDAREWWYGFVLDLLTNYPEIDGIDFAEPVVSWEKGDACYCEHCKEAFVKHGKEMTLDEIRSQPVSLLLRRSIAITHRAGKQVSMTFVVTATPSGEIFGMNQMRSQTGFDLASLLHAQSDEIPDIICPEFIWQEWKSRYPGKNPSSQPFSPEWTEQAFSCFLQEIDSPIEVNIHLEITDFPGADVDVSAFEATLEAALDGGAFGIDVYSSSQLDKKNGWSFLASFKEKVKKKKCLVLFDPESDRNDAIQTGELLRHFNTEVILQPMNTYTPGLIHEYDNVFYVGTEEGSPIPSSLMDDLMHLRTTLCWLGFNIEALLRYDPLSNHLGIECVSTEKNQYHSVSYKKMVLRKEDPWMNVVKVINKNRCLIYARASDGTNESPYAIRSGRYFWLFADVPSSYAIEGGRFLVFADLLHDILNEDHAEQHSAMVRIEDIHPLSNTRTLKKIADYLHSQNVPFQVAFVPYYVYPDMNLYVSMREKPGFISALKYMVKKGGTLVMHGVTHQRFMETTTDYEFWDPVSDSPIEGQTETEIRQRVEKGIRECWSNGIYPLLWETPHYAGSQNFYSVISKIFSIAMERRQAIDATDTDQYLPYAICSDRYGQTILPENLGYVPLDNPKAEVITKPAKNMKVVRDGVASFFFHPFVDMNVLKNLIRNLKKEQFVFTNATGFPIHVRTSFGLIQNQDGAVNFATENSRGQEKRLAFPGIVHIQKEVWADSEGEYLNQINLKKGEIYALHFNDPRPEPQIEDRQKHESREEKDLQALKNVANLQGESYKIPIPLLVIDSEAEGKAHNEIHSFESIFDLVGVELQKKKIEEFTKIPSEINLVIVPTASAASLKTSQIEEIVSAVKSGDVSLITSGFTLLADQLGIEKKAEQIDVCSVIDTYYPDISISWTNPVSVHAFESPEDAVYIYLEKETETPLVIASSFGQGKYLFLSTPLDEDSSFGSARFPYLLTHIFRYLRLSPLIRSANLEVFFNPSEREDISIENLVKFWRRSGIRIIHVAGWIIFPEWTYDYERLIHLAHTNAMLVYAWLEPPYVHEKFWLEHPEWHEKNAREEDAIMDWRKPVALGNPKIMNAVLEEWRAFLERFDWDGVTINRLGFESEEGPQSPESYTPFHPWVLEQFKKEWGINPIELFNPASTNYWKNNPETLKKFNTFRKDLARNYLDSLLKMLCTFRTQERNSWEIILSHDSKRVDSGIDTETLFEFKRKYGFKLQLIPSMERQWKLPSEKFEIVQLSISPTKDGSPFNPYSPTSYPTGISLYHLLKKFIDNTQRFTIFSENSLHDVDTKMFPFILASDNSASWIREGLFVRAPFSGEIVFSDRTLKNIAIDGVPAGSFYRNHLVMPIGEHIIAPVNNIGELTNGLKSKARLVDSSGDLLRCEITSRGIDVFYRSDKRTALIINDKPLSIYLNEKRIKVISKRGLLGWAIMLPRGQHTASIITRNRLDLFLTSVSLSLSKAIIVISTISVIVLVLIFSVSRVFSKKRSQG